MTEQFSDPLVLSTTFEWERLDRPPPHEYARISNPLRTKLEQRLQELECGTCALATSSGQSAILLALSLLKAGDHVICAADVYDGTIRTLKVLERFGITHTLLAPKELERINEYTTEKTKLVILENPSSTLLNTFDTKRIKKNIGEVQLVVDSTVATPIFRKQLEFGADFVVHSLGKFIGGHDDLIGGTLVTNKNERIDELKHLQHTLGIPLPAFDCSLTIRSIETLEARMRKHSENAKAITKFLMESKKIEKINFPGFGGLLSFQLGKEITFREFFSKVKLPIAQSYGGPKTRIQHPITMINSSLSQKMKKSIGLDERIIRIAIGLEDKYNIIKKLECAL